MENIPENVDWNTVPNDAILEMGNYIAFWGDVKEVMNDVGLEITSSNIYDLIRSSIQVAREERDSDTNRIP